jgi:hypothetical protein
MLLQAFLPQRVGRITLQKIKRQAKIVLIFFTDRPAAIPFVAASDRVEREGGIRLENVAK